MKKAVAISIVLVLIGIGVFAYTTRPVAAPSAQDEQTATTTAGENTYRISSGTVAEYHIDETLNGEPFHVVGSTTNVTGQITFDATNSDEASIGEIRINARTLKTDSDRRDGAVGRYILKSKEAANEFIIFTPKDLSGMPGDVKIGEEYSFNVTGDLTVAGVTKEETFDVKATATDENTILGSATSTISREDYSITIPNVPFVADVPDEFELVLNFTLKK